MMVGNDMTTGGMRELHLFAGAGGGILGGLLLGHTPVCAVELEKYPRAVLLQRQRDGILPWFPIWDDVCTFDGTPWRGRVDLIAGGFPCQDISSAGKGAGITGARSGLWSEFARIIREVRPRYAFIENSPNLTSRGLDVVLSDLASMGFDAEWGVVGAHHAGAPHRRDRIWILGYSNSNRQPDGTVDDETSWMPHLDRNADRQRIGTVGGVCGGASADSCGVRQDVADTFMRWGRRSHRTSWWGREPAEALLDAGRGGGQENGLLDLEPKLGRVANGMAHRVDRLRAIGNGQVPQAAAMAFRILWERLHNG